MTEYEFTTGREAILHEYEDPTDRACIMVEEMADEILDARQRMDALMTELIALRHWRRTHELQCHVHGERKSLRDLLRDALRKDAASLREFVENDGIAMTYQTLGQYRTALLKFPALGVQPTTTTGETQ